MIVMVQTVSAARHARGRVVLTGWVKTEPASAAQMWLRVDAGRTVVALDNMSDRPISSTTPWTEYRLVLDVPGGATALALGLLLHGGGRAWADDLSLTIAEPGEAATTDVLPTRRVFRHDLETLSGATADASRQPRFRAETIHRSMRSILALLSARVPLAAIAQVQLSRSTAASSIRAAPRQRRDRHDVGPARRRDSPRHGGRQRRGSSSPTCRRAATASPSPGPRGRRRRPRPPSPSPTDCPSP